MAFTGVAIPTPDETHGELYTWELQLRDMNMSHEELELHSCLVLSPLRHGTDQTLSLSLK